MRKVAFVWNHQHEERPWSCHYQFLEATLRQYENIEVCRYNFSNWQTMPTDLDLYIFADFDQSLFKINDKSYHPRIFYWLDSFHHSFVYLAQVINCFDMSYLSEYQTVKALRNMNISKVRWLPAAYYPNIYRPINIPKSYHWAFVGQPDDVVIRKGLTRKAFFEKLYTEPGLRGYVNQGVYGDDINRIYNESTVLLDRTIYYNLGTRFFETIGSGGFLLVNRGPISNGADEISFDGQHYISYDDSYEDCVDKLRYYLEHTRERQRIARNGEDYFTKHHTYKHRVDSILTDLGLEI
jgi:hypothetical protein